jgi:Ca2+-binding RTX toxin-like protein
VSYTLSANVENLILTGLEAINGTGNMLNNTLTGNSAANTLNGGAGDDSLDGGAGADTLIGGLGNDSYTVDNTGDVVTETSTLTTEIDSVYSAISYTLGANVEKLILTGSAAINGTGNELANTLIGNEMNNTLNGGAGNDLLIGGAGQDILTGGAGNDIFAFIDPVDFMNGLKLPARNPVRDFITDFVSGQDKIDLSALDADEKGDNGDQAFALISTAFNAPGQIRYSAGIISINTDKDSAAEYEIVLTGLIPITLSATDFIL